MSIDTELLEEQYNYIFGLVKKDAGIILNDSKKYLITSRLTLLAKKQNIDSLAEMVSKVQSGDLYLKKALVLSLATHETYFFRDESFFKMIREKVFPMMLNRRLEQKQLTIWSCGCSTGQEPYSLSMMLEEFSMRFPGFKNIIYATDLSEIALEKAKNGIYNEFEINRGLPQSLKERYFFKEGNAWKISDKIKKNVIFSVLNLLETQYPFQKVDIILLRNVLIYFDTPTKQRIINLIQRKLKKDGVLLLGSSENILNLSTRLVPVKNETTYYYEFYNH